MARTLSTAADYAYRLARAVQNNEQWRNHKTLNLIPSENFASPRSLGYLATDLSNRYTAPDRFYRGTKFADEVKDIAEKLAKRVYRAKFADVSPLSGHTCSLIVFMSLLKKGDSVLTCDPKVGGYPGSSKEGLAPLLGIRNLHFPFDREAMNILPQKTKSLIRLKRPKLTIFGSSTITFPYSIKLSTPTDYDGYTIYDGSHVMGLIAGGKFQDPLREGCSLLMGSTHKTLFGPQGGLIVSNDKETFEKVQGKIFPGIVDNIHLNRVASLAYALAELLEFGRDYADQVIKNSKALASTLHDLGVKVKSAEYGYTQSHQVLLDYDDKTSERFANKLQNVDVITDVSLRLGTAEVTRRGMKEQEMERIARVIHEVLNQNRLASETRLKVHKLAREFGSLDYSFSNNS
jgi:glycine hydroxymethyltransferase